MIITICSFMFHDYELTLFRMGEQKGPPYQFFVYNLGNFSPVSIGVSPRIFLNFSFNTFCPKLLSLNQDHPSKKVVFLVKSLKLRLS